MNCISVDILPTMKGIIPGPENQVVGVEEKNYKVKGKLNSIENEAVKTKENF